MITQTRIRYIFLWFVFLLLLIYHHFSKKYLNLSFFCGYRVHFGFLTLIYFIFGGKLFSKAPSIVLLVSFAPTYRPPMSFYLIPDSVYTCLEVARVTFTEYVFFESLYLSSSVGRIGRFLMINIIRVIWISVFWRYSQ